MSLELYLQYEALKNISEQFVEHIRSSDLNELGLTTEAQAALLVDAKQVCTSVEQVRVTLIDVPLYPFRLPSLVEDEVPAEDENEAPAG